MMEHWFFIHDAPPVQDQPEVEMTGWVVCEKQMPGQDPTLHFVGEIPSVTRLRVTSPITSLDWQSCTGVTSSGRRYRLVGPPAAQPDALLALWPGADRLVDVTQLLLNSN